MTVIAHASRIMASPFDRSYHVPYLNTTGSPFSSTTSSSTSSTDEERMNNNAMPTEQLASLCFPADLDLSSYYTTTTTSNTTTRINNSSSSELMTSMSLDDLRRISDNSNKHISKTTVSRQGRDLQRFEGSSEHGVVARLTTGTVPIFKDGRILLISSNKAGWVLPKGGWEQDESLPAAAIRETFEEAGVFGILGKPFPSLMYETRKAQKKRLEHKRESGSPCYLSDGTTSSVNSSSKSSMDMYPIASAHAVTPDSSNSSSNNRSSRITVRRTEHTHNRMTIFPLYVQHVCEEWPEMQRRRIAVTIDEAERLLKKRPEFLSVLRQLKEHGAIIQKTAGKNTEEQVGD